MKMEELKKKKKEPKKVNLVLHNKDIKVAKQGEYKAK
jgi:hypothetical protein